MTSLTSASTADEQRPATDGPSDRPSERPWWRDAVVYQVYLRSFADSDGDGIGDLEGLRTHLDHIAGLGANGIWINPCYPSPQADHGYDVADYFDIEPAYGDLATFDRMLADAHARGLRVLMDIVPNHCSSDHAWFRAALAAPPGSRERARFIFRDGQGPDGSVPPNRWRSVFGGPAWTRVTEADGRPGQWYLHLFDPGQPDFDWRNPEVGDMFEQVLRFWFDRGVDGFRIDVAHGLVKAAELPEWDFAPHAAGEAGQAAPMWDQPEVHDVYRRWRQIAQSYGSRDITFVGEIWVHDADALALYLRPDELPQAFHFDLLIQPWLAPHLRASVQRGLDHVGSTGATVTWTLANHDVHRAVTRYGRDQSLVVVDPDDPVGSTRALVSPIDVAQGSRIARAAGLVTMALPGSLYVYQGEELGLPEVLDIPDEARQDPIFVRSHGRELGRDGSRVPIPWVHDAPSFGFSAGEDVAAPWLPQPDWFGAYAVDVERAEPDSTYNLVRRALALRGSLWSEPDEPLRWLETPGRDDVLAFARGGAVCACVCAPEPFELPQEWGEVVIASARPAGRLLPGDAAAWLRPGAPAVD
jgi:alpha-glucosidase